MKRKIPSLLAPQAIGGDIAEGGFQYQANLITARVPDWLAQDGFTEMIRESIGDVEAKFFVPGLGFCCELVEYKNHRLIPSEFWPEIEYFQKLDGATPSFYHKFVLACTGISQNLNTMIEALRRVRKAYAFYQGANLLQEESINDFVRIVKELGKSEEMAKFIFSKVWLEVDLTDAEDHPREFFREALLKNFPIFDDLQTKFINTAYSRLSELIRFNKSQPISRQKLEEAIWGCIDAKYKPYPFIRIETLHDNSCDKQTKGSLSLDWIAIFGGSERKYPPDSEWNKKVIGELQSVKDWIISTNRSRKIHLSGYRRLSASVAIGATFSSVSGFIIEMEMKDGIWKTNSYPKTDTPDYIWEYELYKGKPDGEIAVGIGIKKNVFEEVEQYLKSKGFIGSRIYLFGKSAILSDEHANKAVDKIKEILLQVIAQTNTNKIHLFIAVPAQFALFLGHRLNATCAIQCYERQIHCVYMPTCVVNTSSAKIQ